MLNNPRQQRGLEIAATANIVRKAEGEWSVPSQSHNGRYEVRRGMMGFSCNCPDHELTGQPCKHSYAVEFFLKREIKPDGTVIETRAARLTYSQNWPAYNRAQVSEKGQFCALLRDLVSSVPTPEQKRGRPSLPLSDMLFAAAFKTYSTVSARRFMTDLATAQSAGFIDRVPHYNSIFNCLEKESLTPILHELITQSALPLRAVETDFAVDSTGFGCQSFYRHYSAKYGREQTFRDYRKLHAVIGTNTNVIACARVTDRDVNDSPVLAPMVRNVAQNFVIERVSADKAYCSHKNLELIESFGAEPLIPFRQNATVNPKLPLWNRLFHYFQFSREEFLAKYHRRSNAESTFSAMKRKFGSTLRSKTDVSRQNELLMIVLCHNLVCLIHAIEESGIAPMFPGLCPINNGAAQEGGH